MRKVTTGKRMRSESGKSSFALYGKTIHLKVPIGFRLEVRDFYSGLPNYNQNLSTGRQRNVVFTGGLLIRFR